MNLNEVFSNYINTSNEAFWKYFLITYLVIIIVGIFLGAYKKITIYENFDDLGITLLIFILPIVIIAGLSYWGVTIEKWMLYILGAIEIVLTLITFIKSFKSNSNIFGGFYSIIVKIPVAILFILLVVELFIPGSTRKRRNSNKGYLFLALLVFTPILLSLIKDKHGLFSPQFLINRARFNY